MSTAILSQRAFNRIYDGLVKSKRDYSSGRSLDEYYVYAFDRTNKKGDHRTATEIMMAWIKANVESYNLRYDKNADAEEYIKDLMQEDCSPIQLFKHLQALAYNIDDDNEPFISEVKRIHAYTQEIAYNILEKTPDYAVADWFEKGGKIKRGKRKKLFAVLASPLGVVADFEVDKQDEEAHMKRFQEMKINIPAGSHIRYQNHAPYYYAAGGDTNIITLERPTYNLDIDKEFRHYKYVVYETEPIQLSNGNWMHIFKVTKYSRDIRGDFDEEQEAWEREAGYAKGGIIKIADRDKQVLAYRVHNQGWAGNFGLKYVRNGKNPDFDFYALDDFDKTLITNIKLKEGEAIFRYDTEMLRSMRHPPKPFIKINFIKQLVYFLDDDAAEKGETVFDKRGVELRYLQITQEAYNALPFVDKTYVLENGRFNKVRQTPQERYDSIYNGVYSYLKMKGVDRWRNYGEFDKEEMARLASVFYSEIQSKDDKLALASAIEDFIKNEGTTLGDGGISAPTKLFFRTVKLSGKTIGTLFYRIYKTPDDTFHGTVDFNIGDEWHKLDSTHSKDETKVKEWLKEKHKSNTIAIFGSGGDISWVNFPTGWKADVSQFDTIKRNVAGNGYQLIDSSSTRGDVPLVINRLYLDTKGIVDREIEMILKANPKIKVSDEKVLIEAVDGNKYDAGGAAEARHDEDKKVVPVSIQALRDIKEHGYGKVRIDGKKYLVDTLTASAMILVYDALKPELQKMFEEKIKTLKGFSAMQSFAFKNTAIGSK